MGIIPTMTLETHEKPPAHPDCQALSKAKATVFNTAKPLEGHTGLTTQEFFSLGATRYK